MVTVDVVSNGARVVLALKMHLSCYQQAKNGHARAYQNHQDPEIKALGKWSDYQRQCYVKRQKGLKVALDEERIGKL